VIRHRNKPTHRGFTLLETLASLVILSLAVVAGGRWLVSIADYSESLRRESSRALIAARAAELLRDDLFAAFPGSECVTTDEGVISMTTPTQLPGEPPGWHEVRWSYDESRNAVIRSASPVNTRAEARPRTVAVQTDLWRLDRSSEDESNGEPAICILELSIQGLPVRRVVFEAIEEDGR